MASATPRARRDARRARVDGFPVAPDHPLEFSGWLTSDLVDYVGGFSEPSKMPGRAYGLPAEDCQTGGRLQKVRGSVCFDCYALKGAYAWSTTKAAYRRRADRLSAPYWSDAVAEVLNRRATRGEVVFRWHDSGDLQSVDHLADIVRVATLTPDVAHWLPTREYGIVREYLGRFGGFPENLTVRLSAHKVGGHVPAFRGLADHVAISTVSADGVAPEGAHSCPSRSQGNQCGDCRACWSRDVWHVDYAAH